MHLKVRDGRWNIYTWMVFGENAKLILKNRWIFDSSTKVPGSHNDGLSEMAIQNGKMWNCQKEKIPTIFSVTASTKPPGQPKWKFKSGNGTLSPLAICISLLKKNHSHKTTKV